MTQANSYTLSPYHDPTRTRFVPQEALNLNDDFLLPTRIPTDVPILFPKRIKIVETNLDYHSRSLYTSLVHEYYTIAKLNFEFPNSLLSFSRNTINTFPPCKR